MNKKATFYKYAKLYSYLIKEAEKVRDYNYIPKNSILSKELAEKYWPMKNDVLNDPWFSMHKIRDYNGFIRHTIDEAQSAFPRKPEAFAEGMKEWANRNVINNVNNNPKYVIKDPRSAYSAGSFMYLGNSLSGEQLKKHIADAINAENAIGLITPYIEDPQVRNYVNNVPIRIVGFNDHRRKLSPGSAAHFKHSNNEILMGQTRKNPHTAVHEAMHALQYGSTNASNEAIANWKNSTYDKNKLTEPYSYVDENGVTVTRPRVNATYAVESGANQLANDYTRKATENLPPRLRNIIRRGMEVEGDITNAVYQRRLGIDPNAVIPQKTNYIKFTKAVNTAARMAKVNAKKNLDIAGARKASMPKSLIDLTIDLLKEKGYKITPEIEEAIRQGYMVQRKKVHSSLKNSKQQAWLKRVKNNPALLEKAKRLGRFVKVGHYKRMYKIFKLLLQGV